MSKEDDIVKVQRSIVTTESQQQVLIYNEDRSIMAQFDLANDKADQLFEPGEMKSFHHAKLTPDGTVHLTGPAPWQEW